MSRILLVDDEIDPGASEPDMDYMWFYAEALRKAGHALVMINTVDEALNRLTHVETEFDLAILDVMMPPGRKLAKASHRNGMHTGIYLALRASKLRSKLPMVILTNSHDPEIQKKLLDDKRPVVKAVLLKDDVPPFELVKRVSTFLPLKK